MAEVLKNQFGVDVPKAIAKMVLAVHPDFDSAAYLNLALDGYDALELMPRGEKIADALHPFLPDHYPDAIQVLIESFSAAPEIKKPSGMASFLYLPHSYFVAKYGLEHFEESMAAQYEITQRFTAEFCIWPFLEHHPEATLKQLAIWTQDPSEHVRRLVSEGTRPRLPWAARLRGFQQDPAPVLRLLEALKDDESLYVRRSVANNLNDIGKDHPQLLTQIARSWMVNASTERRWLVRHALRSVVKRGDRAALAILGFGSAENLAISGASIDPDSVAMGGSICVSFVLSNRGSCATRVLADFRIHYVKANGLTAAKVFKLKELELMPGERVTLSKKVSVANMTTRKHYPGVHCVEAILNGEVRALGEFILERSGSMG